MMNGPHLPPDERVNSGDPDRHAGSRTADPAIVHGSGGSGPPTEVCITIDTEFSIAGAFTDPVRQRPIGEENVNCPADGQDNGLGFLLDTFRNHGTPATFFVEALQSAYFGDRPMGRIVERILRGGQDVQLHIHPCWLFFRDADWARKLAQTPPNDSCEGRSVAEMQELITEGLARLRRLGAPAPIAMRTGNLHADKSVYRAMAACGLRVASNLGIAHFRPRDPDLHLKGGRHWIGDVLEVPVLTYRQLPRWTRRPERLLTITACSSAEIESLLWQARRAGVPTIVLMTHPFEFIKRRHLGPAGQRANRINKRRLERLCEFIARHPADFTAVGFAKAAPGWLETASVPDPALKAPLAAVLARTLINMTNDLIPAA
jgi:hypothetical protein